MVPYRLMGQIFVHKNWILNLHLSRKLVKKKKLVIKYTRVTQKVMQLIFLAKFRIKIFFVLQF
jgi:hypothetical protein